MIDKQSPDFKYILTMDSIQIYLKIALIIQIIKTTILNYKFESFKNISIAIESYLLCLIIFAAIIFWKKVKNFFIEESFMHIRMIIAQNVEKIKTIMPKKEKNIINFQYIALTILIGLYTPNTLLYTNNIKLILIYNLIYILLIVICIKSIINKCYSNPNIKQLQKSGYYFYSITDKKTENIFLIITKEKEIKKNTDLTLDKINNTYYYAEKTFNKEQP